MAKTPDSIFAEFFLPQYPNDARDLVVARTVDANPKNHPRVFEHLREAADIFVRNASAMLDVAPEQLDYSDASVHRLAVALTPERRDALAAQGSGSDNALFNVVIHGAAYVGECIVRSHGGTWAVRRPLWESLVHLKSPNGEGDLPIFHWWLKSLAEDSSGASLADRYRTHVEVPFSGEERSVLAPVDRKLPRLSKVRYDVFYKYLRANLPELRDVGRDFPSPERFDELGFKHLSFTLVGGGRMLVVHGPNANGLHAFWLGREGFEKAAFWPSDAFPEPLLRAREDRLEVVLSREGKVVSFETMWWGP